MDFSPPDSSVHMRLLFSSSLCAWDSSWADSWCVIWLEIRETPFWADGEMIKESIGILLGWVKSSVVSELAYQFFWTPLAVKLDEIFVEWVDAGLVTCRVVTLRSYFSFWEWSQLLTQLNFFNLYHFTFSLYHYISLYISLHQFTFFFSTSHPQADVTVIPFRAIEYWT